MRVGVYNRWLATLGGGEKHSLGVAEYLSQQHTVTVVTHKPVDREMAARVLNLDLSRVEFSIIPDRPVTELTPLTADYDFFINASHLDFFPSLAAHSAALIYFPAPLGLERILRWGRRAKLLLRQGLMVPLFSSGVYSLETFDNTHLRLIDSVLRVNLPAHFRSYHLRFALAACTPQTRQATISLNGEKSRLVQLPADQQFVACELTVPRSTNGSCHELMIESDVRDSNSPAQMRLSRFEIDHPRFRLYQFAFERSFKRLGLEMHYIPPPGFSILDSMDTYDAIWANSGFTQKWIKKYWNRPSAVLYPPIDISEFRPGTKKQYILNVGRFFAGNHNKKHLVLVQTFKEMVDQGLVGWELHLAGGAMPGDEHERYLRKVTAAAAGYPIQIHADMPFPELVKLYGESAIYWHASGFGEDENREPGKFEHFGITTVEAMAAGCVPVVIGKGGQPEIVQSGVSGFLWDTTDELKAFTRQLMIDNQLRDAMSVRAVQESRRYDKSHFHRQLHHLLQEVGVD